MGVISSVYLAERGRGGRCALGYDQGLGAFPSGSADSRITGFRSDRIAELLVMLNIFDRDDGISSAGGNDDESAQTSAVFRTCR